MSEQEDVSSRFLSNARSELAQVASQLRKTIRLTPIAIVASFYLLGILVDRIFDVPLWIITSTSLILCLSWVVLLICKNRFATHCLLMFWLTLGLLNHHLCWSPDIQNDIRSLISKKSEPIFVRAQLIKSPERIPVSEENKLSVQPQIEKTRLSVKCEQYLQDGAWHSVSGKMLVYITGQTPHLQIGDDIEMLGRFFIPSPSNNPGEWDFESYMRQKQISCLMTVRHPDGVKRLTEGGWEWGLSKWRSSVRRFWETTFEKHLREENYPLAVALTLGDRTSLTPDIQHAFLASGAMHFLAISGMHIGILFGAIFFALRISNISLRRSLASSIVLIILFAFVTEARPSVIRATIMLTFGVIGPLLGRRISPLSSLVLAAFIILLFDPLAIFDIGAQLSFIAIGVIIVYSGLQNRQEEKPLDELEAEMIESERSPFQKFLFHFWGLFKSGVYLSTIIWLIAMPLVAGTFHFTAPLGSIVSVLLWPVLALGLITGFLLPLVEFIVPSLSWIPGWTFDFMLTVMQWSVINVSKVFDFHGAVAAPPYWWILIFYLLLVCIPLLKTTSALRTTFQVFFIAWIFIGTTSSLVANERFLNENELRCTFLNVGHGGAAFIQNPNGTTMLYDIGSFQGPQRAWRPVDAALREMGHSRINLAVLSHSDLDHYNGYPALSKRIQIDQMFLSQSFLDLKRFGVSDILNSAKTQNTQIKLIQKDDQIELDPDVKIKVLHPSGDFSKWNETDNQNSIVLKIEFGNRSILLTGDVEEDGQNELIENENGEFDFVQAPHHGSKRSNKLRFGQWCNTPYVIVSDNDRKTHDNLQTAYGPKSELLSTSLGAIQIRIHRSGNYRIFRWNNGWALIESLESSIR